MKKQHLIFLTSIITLIVFWCSCNKKEQAVAPPLPGNEPLTTMVLKATNAADATDTVSASWVKLNPDDTSLAMVQTLHLKANTTYNVQVQLLDTLTDITGEIRDRENYHLLCFTPTSGLSLSITATDKDTNNPPLPVGLQDQFVAGGASTGSMEVTLHHQPNVKNGSCSPSAITGSIDLDCTFPVTIN